MRFQYSNTSHAITGTDPDTPGVDFAVNFAPGQSFTSWTITGNAPDRVLTDPDGHVRAHEDTSGPEAHPTLATLAAEVEGGVPEIAASPTAQGIVDALVALGLVTQAS